jgi:hypothetical protein
MVAWSTDRLPSSTMRRATRYSLPTQPWRMNRPNLMRVPGAPQAAGIILIRSSASFTPSPVKGWAGSRAVMTLDNFIGPHYGNVVPSLVGRISVTIDRDTLLEESFAGETTYWYQLQAFCNAVAGGPALPVQGEGAVANMTLIDAVRAAARI